MPARGSTRRPFAVSADPGVRGLTPAPSRPPRRRGCSQPAAGRLRPSGAPARGSGGSPRFGLGTVQRCERAGTVTLVLAPCVHLNVRDIAADHLGSGGAIPRGQPPRACEGPGRSRSTARVRSDERGHTSLHSLDVKPSPDSPGSPGSVRGPESHGIGAQSPNRVQTSHLVSGGARCPAVVSGPGWGESPRPKRGERRTQAPSPTPRALAC